MTRGICVRRNGSLPAAAESCKKGTLKLDLQSLTVGVAVVSMGAWLLSARAALLQDAPTSLDAARKLAVVNGLGEHSRAQVLALPLFEPGTLCVKGRFAFDILCQHQGTFSEETDYMTVNQGEPLCETIQSGCAFATLNSSIECRWEGSVASIMLCLQSSAPRVCSELI